MVQNAGSFGIRTSIFPLKAVVSPLGCCATHVTQNENTARANPQRPRARLEIQLWRQCPYKECRLPICGVPSVTSCVCGAFGRGHRSPAHLTAVINKGMKFQIRRLKREPTKNSAGAKRILSKYFCKKRLSYFGKGSFLGAVLKIAGNVF